MTHHPHLHIIVPGGGISPDGERWIACRPGFFLPVRVLSRLFRRLFLEKLTAARDAGQLQFFGEHASLADRDAFAAFLARLRKVEWVVYAKKPFAGPEAVLAYLARYTHRVAISNSRLLTFDDTGVTFRWKDYRADGRARYKTMTLTTPEFIRRFLLHVLPPGFHRIRHYGLFASGQRRAAIAQARTLLDAARPRASAAVRYGIDSEAEVEESATTASPEHRCPCCGGRMIVVETFERGSAPRHQTAIIGIDSS
jgi:hypothetical protein